MLQETAPFSVLQRIQLPMELSRNFANSTFQLPDIRVLIFLDFLVFFILIFSSTSSERGGSAPLKPKFISRLTSRYCGRKLTFHVKHRLRPCTDLSVYSLDFPNSPLLARETTTLPPCPHEVETQRCSMGRPRLLVS